MKSMRITLGTMIVIMAVILLAGIVSVKILVPERRRTGRPDLVVLLIRDRGARLEREAHPAIEEIAARGVAYRDCRAASPVYSAAAASLLAGRNPSAAGTAGGAPAGETLAAALAARGYRTNAFLAGESLLPAAGVLDGMESVVQGWDAADLPGAVADLADGRSPSPFFLLIEADSGRLKGGAGIESMLRRLADALERIGFFANGVLVLCAPESGGRALFLLAGEPLGAEQGLEIRSPLALEQGTEILIGLADGLGFGSCAAASASQGGPPAAPQGVQRAVPQEGRRAD